MFTTNLEHSVRGETDMDLVKNTLIDWLDAVVKGNVDHTDLREQAQIVLDCLVKVPEHVCECDHDEDEIDELKSRVHDLREQLYKAKEDRDELQDELDTALASLEGKAAA